MKKSLIALALGSALVALPAAAQWNSPLMSQAYIGAAGGEADPGDFGDGEREGYWKAFAGLGFNQVIGIELGYHDLGNYAPNDTDITAWTLAATAQMPLTPSWYLMGKIGAAQNRIDGNIKDDDRTDLYAGLGVGMRFNKNFGLRLEYEYFGEVPEEDAGLDRERVQAVSLGLTWAFP